MRSAMLAGLVGLVTAAAVAPAVLMALRGRVMDIPTHRSSHDRPVPRGGGIAIVIGAVAGTLASSTPIEGVVAGVLIVALLMAAIGLLEDLRGVEVLPRFLLQVAAIGAGLPLLLNNLDGSAQWAATAIVVTVIWVAGYTNGFNFMDGINGIAGGQMLLAGVVWLVVGALNDLPVLRDMGAVTAGAAAGFLPWNFPNARFFMGDVGSYFAGAWLASLALLSVRLGVPVPAAIAPLVLFGIDTSYTLGVRIAGGERWYRPHRSHIYQRIVRAGWSHAKTTGAYVTLSAIIATGLLAWLSESIAARAAGTLAASAGIVTYLVLPQVVSALSQHRG